MWQHISTLPHYNNMWQPFAIQPYNNMWQQFTRQPYNNMWPRCSSTPARGPSASGCPGPSSRQGMEKPKQLEGLSRAPSSTSRMRRTRPSASSR
eukprot:5236435-Heterocapsa_arctica.AAC.1